MKKVKEIIKSKKYKKGKDSCGYKPIFILDNIPEIKANEKPNNIHLDKRGYFLIRIHNKQIEAGQVNKNNEMFRIIKGKNAEEIYTEIIKRKWISRLDHASYLGSELKKAELFLKGKIKKYVQE